jgi:hypothetical protein
VDPSDLVGLVSGLIAIFTFLTGVTSVRELRRGGRAGGGPPVAEPRRARLRLVLGLSVPVFLVTSIYTLSQGLAGSDTGGAQFLLLVAGALLLAFYATALRRTVPWAVFAVVCAVALPALGLVMGSISRGEEAEGIASGLLVGVGVALLGLAFRGGTPGARPAAGPAPDREREVLGVVRARGGEVTVGDVALDTSLGLDEARAVLDQLAARGFCRREAAPGGAVLYRFPDFRPR